MTDIASLLQPQLTRDEKHAQSSFSPPIAVARAMAYVHDVFISYRREHNWTRWVRDHFKTLLQSYLQQELGRRPDIYVDEKIEVGADWPDELGEHLAISRAVVAIFSRDYFTSEYCLHELDLAVERSKSANPGERRCRLIVPVVVQDGELIPDPITRTQAADFKDYRIAEICKGTQIYMNFSVAMRNLAPSILAAIYAAPEFEIGWIAHCKQRFTTVYESDRDGNRIDPSHFVRPQIPVPKRTPRLTL